MGAMRHREDEEGFTLIELLVVIIIIGILASIAIPAFLGQRSRANLAALKTDLRNIASRAETYQVDNLTYIGFLGDALTPPDAEFTAYATSPGVEILPSNGTTGNYDYCISGTHPKVDGPWRYDNDASPQLGPGSC